MVFCFTLAMVFLFNVFICVVCRLGWGLGLGKAGHKSNIIKYKHFQKLGGGDGEEERKMAKLGDPTLVQEQRPQAPNSMCVEV